MGLGGWNIHYRGIAVSMFLPPQPGNRMYPAGLFFQLSGAFLQRLTAASSSLKMNAISSIASCWGYIHPQQEILTGPCLRKIACLMIYREWYRENLPGWLEETVIMV